MTPHNHYQNGPYEASKIQYYKYLTQDEHYDIRNSKALIFLGHKAMLWLNHEIYYPQVLQILLFTIYVQFYAGRRIVN